MRVQSTANIPAYKSGSFLFTITDKARRKTRRFSVEKWPFSACFEATSTPIVLKVQDDHQCANEVSQMQHCRLPPSSVLVQVFIVLKDVSDEHVEPY